VGQENALASDWKKAVPQGFVGEDMVDAQIDLTFVLEAHGTIFAHFMKKASLMLKHDARLTGRKI
jgi:hypothetical protein